MAIIFEPFNHFGEIYDRLCKNNPRVGYIQAVH